MTAWLAGLILITIGVALMTPIGDWFQYLFKRFVMRTFFSFMGFIISVVGMAFVIAFWYIG